MTYTKITIKETRNNLSELIERAALAKETFLVTKFGKPKALIVSAQDFVNDKRKKIDILKETTGLWAGRKDIKTGDSWVAKIRKKGSSRYEKILS